MTVKGHLNLAREVAVANEHDGRLYLASPEQRALLVLDLPEDL
jgi:hypothetical protein